jgi:protein-S-isoprenylcysteine O-methyltransferase Ste14
MFFLIVSLARKPKAINESLIMFLICILSRNLPLIVSKVGYYFPIMLTKNIIISELAVTAMLLIVPFYIVAIFTLGKSLTILPEAHRLQLKGIYYISRHPIYLIYITWSVLEIFIYQTWAVLFLSILAIFLLIIRAKQEEKILESTFPEYNDYKSKVMWLGRREL